MHWSDACVEGGPTDFAKASSGTLCPPWLDGLSEVVGLRD
jgi:hypothetical protein